MNAIMFGGMFLGAAIGAAKSSTTGISNACSQLEAADQKYSKAKDTWNQINFDEDQLDQQIKDNLNDLQTSFTGYESALNDTILTIKQNQFKKDMVIVAFITGIFITLMIKYFKIYQKIGGLLGFFKNGKWVLF